MFKRAKMLFLLVVIIIPFVLLTLYYRKFTGKQGK